jgi:hypothetical protein
MEHHKVLFDLSIEQKFWISAGWWIQNAVQLENLKDRNQRLGAAHKQIFLGVCL